MENFHYGLNYQTGLDMGKLELDKWKYELRGGTVLEETLLLYTSHVQHS